eukprot:COSAG05_NODE_702_length_7857_cov_37.135244_6_plen_150_part_00
MRRRQYELSHTCMLCVCVRASTDIYFAYIHFYRADKRVSTQPRCPPELRKRLPPATRRGAVIRTRRTFSCTTLHRMSTSHETQEPSCHTCHISSPAIQNSKTRTNHLPCNARGSIDWWYACRVNGTSLSSRGMSGFGSGSASSVRVFVC